jgi:hypothetical protein
MPELLDHKTNYLKPFERDKYTLAKEIDIPDRKTDIPIGGINVDKLHADRINEKNDKRLKNLNYYEKTIR